MAPQSDPGHARVYTDRRGQQGAHASYICPRRQGRRPLPYQGGETKWLSLDLWNLRNLWNPTAGGAPGLSIAGTKMRKNRGGSGIAFQQNRSAVGFHRFLRFHTKRELTL